MNLDSLNRYVLAVIGAFAVLLYAGVLYAGFVEFRAHTSKRRGRKKGFRKARAGRSLRNKQEGVQRFGGSGKDLTLEQKP